MLTVGIEMNAKHDIHEGGQSFVRGTGHSGHTIPRFRI